MRLNVILIRQLIVKPSSNDPFELERFIDAQRNAYGTALAELRRGEKRSHWMWFIFPQAAGLGSSWMADRYAIRSRAEAVAYATHPVLGPRVAECAETLLQVSGKAIEDVMGYPDYLKLKSSMTLFAAVSPPGSVYQRVLERYFDGTTDPKTIEYLSAHP